MDAELTSRCERLRSLHRGPPMLVLPNAWDAASAAEVVRAGFPVVATASAAISAMLGYPDGEGAPWSEMFAAAGRISRAVEVPVTVDAEAGYGLPPRELVDRLAEIGVAGCNLEDTDHRAGGLVDAGVHAERLAAIRSAAADAGVPIVINARTDVFLGPSGVPEADRVDEAVRRGRRYLEAGADCIYPIGISARPDIAAVVSQLSGPVNANTGPETDLDTLRDLGVARVSYGPRFYRQGLADFASALGDLRAAAPN